MNKPTKGKRAGLEADGFRFIGRNGDWQWRHPAEVQPGDIDATNMTDGQFERAVREPRLPI